MPAPRPSWLGLCVLLGCMAAWSGWFIARVCHFAGGVRYFCLFDDAMISMTYARSLVEGHGLNWARFGAPVEGFTHPLWMALMIPVNALPLDLRFRSLVIQLLSLALLVLHVMLVRRLVRRFFATGRACHWLPAALLTAFYFPLDFWALLGMESGLQALLTTASVLLALDIVHRGQDRHRPLLLLGAAAYLLRMDMLLMVAVVQLYVIARGGLRQPRQRASWYQGIAMLAAVIVGYGIFRWIYFGDLLPNTYYLKLYKYPLDFRLVRGVRMLGETLADHLLLLALFGVLWLLRTRLGAERDGGLHDRLALPAALLLAACAYSIWVGGDAWEMRLNVRCNRFMVYVMPQLFMLFNGWLNEVAGAMAAAARRRLLAIMTVLGLLAADGLLLAAAADENWRDLATSKQPAVVAMQGGILLQLRRLQAVLGPDAVVATYVAGIPAYFSDYRMVDVLGYNERHIARLAPILPVLPNSYDTFEPGHAKWDYSYVVARYQPDSIMTPLAIGPHGTAWRLLKAAGYDYHPEGFYLRRRQPGRRAGEAGDAR